MAKTPQVLIVDENLDSRVDARKALQRANLDVAGEVGMGPEALTYAREKLPDVILLAVEEPVMRPLETAEALANVLPQTPVIFYSSLADAEAMHRAIVVGARDYLTKPLQAARVQDAVNKALAFEEKRQMREAGQLATATVRGTVITVSGAKGGIGKSVIAVNLALALRKSLDRRVVLVDADTDFGDVATMVDLKPQVTASELLEDIDTADRWKVSAYLSQTPQGLQILAAPEEEGRQWQESGPESISRILDLLSQTNDFVVVDTSGSFDPFVRAAIEQSTLLLLVTTGEVSSIRDTKGALKRLRLWDIPTEKIKIVLNRSSRADGLKTKDLEEALGRPVFWEMPRDKFVPRSVQVGEPVVIGRPASVASRSIFALARAIGGTATEAAREAPKTPLFASLRLGRRGS